jgi:hypothetical protein
MAYFQQPDKNEHIFGALSEPAQAIAEELDGYIADLVDGIAERKLKDKIDIIVLADHGFWNITHSIHFDQFVDMNDSRLKFVSGVVNMKIYPTDGDEKSPVLEETLTKLVNAHPNMTCTRRQDVRERFHYSKSDVLECTSQSLMMIRELDPSSAWLTSDMK